MAKRLVIHPNITVHPDYNLTYIPKNDLALIELSTDVKIGGEADHYSVNSICLPKAGHYIGEANETDIRINMIKV